MAALCPWAGRWKGRVERAPLPACAGGRRCQRVRVGHAPVTARLLLRGVLVYQLGVLLQLQHACTRPSLAPVSTRRKAHC